MENEVDTKQKRTLLKDANGNTSSKRVSGFIGLAVAAGMSVFAIIQDPTILSGIIWAWLIFAAAMFGVTILERKK